MAKNNVYTVYNYATRRQDITTEDLSAFIKKVRNQAKKGRKMVKFMSRWENGRTYYNIFIQ